MCRDCIRISDNIHIHTYIAHGTRRAGSRSSSQRNGRRRGVMKPQSQPWEGSTTGEAEVGPEVVCNCSFHRGTCSGHETRRVLQAMIFLDKVPQALLHCRAPEAEAPTARPLIQDPVADTGWSAKRGLYVPVHLLSGSKAPSRLCAGAPPLRAGLNGAPADAGLAKFTGRSRARRSRGRRTPCPRQAGTFLHCVEVPGAHARGCTPHAM
ncbi:hypothetical protein BDY21DRAFT_49619 [Lineolata rhizophorae]|uniref:Uncharacterized protein n=1 Tax=Lineolata rhizophorae TaxID=578093 RepID=A0A6A6NXC6_9PEZI|nr:hypothetical protein BDY21DRAFT_49619 [Lineolata rhizophorae]